MKISKAKLVAGNVNCIETPVINIESINLAIYLGHIKLATLTDPELIEHMGAKFGKITMVATPERVDEIVDAVLQYYPSSFMPSTYDRSSVEVGTYRGCMIERSLVADPNVVLFLGSSICVASLWITS